MVKKIFAPVWCGGMWPIQGLPIDNRIFEELSKECKIEISQKHKMDIQNALLLHSEFAKIELRAPNSVALLESADQLMALTKKLMTGIEQTYANGPNTLTLMLSDSGLKSDFLNDLSRNLYQFSNFCEQVRGTISNRAIEIGRPSKYANLERYILELAMIFEKLGGKASAAYSPNASKESSKSGARNTPFLRFVFGLSQLLPTELQYPKPALAEAIKRVLSKRPKAKQIKN